MTLDIGPLIKAITRLEEALDVYGRDTSHALIRDGLVQRFEFTYEISHRMLKRYLEETSPTPGQFDEMSFQDLIRTGSEEGLLLHGWPEWRTYRDMRSKTSHTYDERVALEVVAGIPAFLDEARFLCEEIARRQA